MRPSEKNPGYAPDDTLRGVQRYMTPPKILSLEVIMYGSILAAPSPLPPPEKVGPSGLGAGNVFKQSCPEVGGGASENTYSHKEL